ncbi:ubiquitin-protein ligase [Dorcoceras hygrometricum]|uniref:Ubiquitin-protein ligase n=1 Tax=Dorcoceras hygrometricum TaxID=472368 RepID=A0A2Z7C8F9_9LAMI|nr:ubiquitin-protein ligase [Dorcoceras hygrometricum]
MARYSPKNRESTSGPLFSVDELSVFSLMTCNHRHWSKGIGNHPDEGPPMLKTARRAKRFRVYYRSGLSRPCVYTSTTYLLPRGRVAKLDALHPEIRVDLKVLLEVHRSFSNFPPDFTFRLLLFYLLQIQQQPSIDIFNSGTVVSCNLTHKLFFEYPRLLPVFSEYSIDIVECGGQMYVVLLLEFFESATIRVWKWDENMDAWQQIAAMPPASSHKFYGKKVDINCSGAGDEMLVCLNSAEVCTYVMCNLVRKNGLNCHSATQMKIKPESLFALSLLSLGYKPTFEKN